mgnify:CR=1 FL=1
MRLFRGGNRPQAVSRPEFERLQNETAAAICAQSKADLGVIGNLIGTATRVIMAKLQQLENRMSKLDDLLGAVEAQQTKIDSLITLTDGLHKAVLEAMGDTITPSQAMRIAQVFDAVKANSDDIDAALTANTVQAAAGAISDGPSAAEIKADLNTQNAAPSAEPVAEEQPSTGQAEPAT